jgi:hypothetical protein
VSDSLYIDTEACFESAGAIRTALEPAGTFPTVAVPDVGVPVAMESLLTASTIAATLPAAIASQLGLIANSITLGAIDVYRADSPCGQSPWMTEDD